LQGGLFRFLQLRAGHRTGLVQDDGEIERGAPVFLPVGNRIEVNFHDDFLRLAPQQDIAVRNEVQVQGFSGEQRNSQTGRQTKDKQCFFHTATVPDGCPKLSWAGQRFVKKM
jgi:hypothetical protein